MYINNNFYRHFADAWIGNERGEKSLSGGGKRKVSLRHPLSVCPLVTLTLFMTNAVEEEEEGAQQESIYACSWEGYGVMMCMVTSVHPFHAQGVKWPLNHCRQKQLKF